MFTTNRLTTALQPLDAADRDHMNPAAAVEAQRLLALCPKYAPTPLVPLPELAKTLGVAEVWVKDESQRLGIGSFKALGGAYAAVRLFLQIASQRLGRDVAPTEIGSAELKAIGRDIVFACATDGNHGRSVAVGARLVNARAVVFVHEGVSSTRVAAIERLGATVHIVPGSYDDAAAQSIRVANAEGWQILSDSSWPGYEAVPRLVAQGYTVMLREIESQLVQPPTHVFTQAGVGGLAATVAAYFSSAYGERRPRLTVVEPERAACIYKSHEAGRLAAIPRDDPTVMSMLECYEPSRIAWNVLSRLADAFMTVSESDAQEAVRCLTEAGALSSTESGAAGLAGLLTVLRSAVAIRALNIGETSRVLLFNTEGRMKAP